jgi:cyclic beta-1,2-glucan synthetase
MSNPYHRLSNGRYHVDLAESGSGRSLFDWIALNRCAADAVDDSQGFFIHLLDLDRRFSWSAGLQPSLTQPDDYRFTADENSVRIERLDHGIATTMEVAVDPVDDLEIRKVTLTNKGEDIRHLELTSNIEIALAHPLGDLGHPAFSKLFVQTSMRSACNTLVAARRPRSADESWPVMFHAILGATPAAWETCRLTFVGRGRSHAHPLGLMGGGLGNVLDPMFALRTRLAVGPGESVILGFLLGATADAAGVESIVLRHQSRWSRPPIKLLDFREAESETIRSDHNNHDLLSPNHIGGFSRNGREYVMRLRSTADGLKLPPMPWCNVVANENFGFLISETGATCTWSRNSQANRLTPWSNDPIIDPHHEAFYLRDDDNGTFWSLFPGPCPAKNADYEMAHGFGYSRCRLNVHGIVQDVTVFVAKNDPVRFMRVAFTNASDIKRRLSLYGHQRLVLGTLPPDPGSLQVDKDGGMLIARNPMNEAFRDGIVFCYGVFDGLSPVTHHCTDRLQFLGPHGSTSRPRALLFPKLSDPTSTAQDCFAMQWCLEIDPGQTINALIVLGEAVGEKHLRDLTEKYSMTGAADQEIKEVERFWRDMLGGLQVKSPAPELDLMVNGWLAYQTIACRIWGRTAFYQSSGAFGFRDQLQDAGNLSLLWPELTRSQILRHARHQFREGDVLHWWHEAPLDRGVRTKFSDDLLWLPYVTADYIRSTGDHAILEEMIPFMEAPLLAPDEDEKFLQPLVSEELSTLWDHCCRAIDRSLVTGSHGLPLMGTGDWNDGMNRIGREGRGESVWLGFFLHVILDAFIPHAISRGDNRPAEHYRGCQKNLHDHLNSEGWDGQWYRRAYYDDGTALGTHKSAECRIDGLAQSWAVLSGATTGVRAETAMDQLMKQLVCEDDGLIRLLTPPFENTPHDPGYIKGYVAGVRENGGQYTHAATWVVMALARLGRRSDAVRMLEMLSPVSHTSTEEKIDRYMVEPYVIAADVYGAAPHVGRGGWTWYTGSAGWAYRVAVESIFGLRLEQGGILVMKPCLPDDWPLVEMTYTHPLWKTVYQITINNPTCRNESVKEVSLDGEDVPPVDGTARIPLSQDGLHHALLIVMGAASSDA